jgi:uncharacterized protein YbjQ (UPF0145 family)
MLELNTTFGNSRSSWLFEENTIIDADSGKKYRFNDTVLCHDAVEEAVAIWHGGKHVDTVRCDSGTYNTMLSKFEKTPTYVPLVQELKLRSEAGNEWELVKGYLKLDRNKISLKDISFELAGDRLDVYDGKEFLLSVSGADGDALIRAKKTYNDHHTLTIKHASIGKDQDREYDDHDTSQGVMITTETSINLPIKARLGIISAEAAYGMNIIRDIRTLWSDKLGGRNKAIQTTLKQAREAALEDLKSEAIKLGGDAVIAVDLDYSEFSGGGKNMMFCVASGTVVKLKRQDGY